MNNREKYQGPFRVVFTLSCLLALGALALPHTASAGEAQLRISFDGTPITQVKRFGYKLLDRQSTYAQVGSYEQMTIRSARATVRGRISVTANTPELDDLLAEEEIFPIHVSYDGKTPGELRILSARIVEKEFIVDAEGNTVISYTFIARRIQQD